MFGSLDEVPTHALTLTIPTLLKSTYTYSIVPTAAKADAIAHTLNDEIQEKYPSTILRQHPHGILYLDEASAAKL
jgi:glucosamine-6-phosphate deaminase